MTKEYIDNIKIAYLSGGLLKAAQYISRTENDTQTHSKYKQCLRLFKNGEKHQAVVQAFELLESCAVEREEILALTQSIKRSQKRLTPCIRETIEQKLAKDTVSAVSFIAHYYKDEQAITLLTDRYTDTYRTMPELAETALKALKKHLLPDNN